MPQDHVQNNTASLWENGRSEPDKKIHGYHHRLYSIDTLLDETHERQKTSQN